MKPDERPRLRGEREQAKKPQPSALRAGISAQEISKNIPEANESATDDLVPDGEGYKHRFSEPFLP